jgi:DNA-binding transcriptional LysR family regulator
MITYPNLYHLKYFVDAAALGSVSGSAHKNLVSHAAVSRAISGLEKHLGTSLLVHQKKSFKLTESGVKVAEQAQILLSTASEFANLSLNTGKAELSEIKIGMSRTLCESYLEPILPILKEKFSGSKTKIRFGTTSEIVEAVADGSVDLGLTIGTLNMATLKQTAISKGQFVLVESGSRKNWGDDFETKAFIVTEPRSETEKLKVLYQREFGRPLPVLFEVSSWDVIGQLTRNGLGIGLLPDIAVKSWQKGSFRKIKSLDFEYPYEIYLHTSRSIRNNRALEYLRDSF